MNYNWNDITGNLESRTDMIQNLTECFTYNCLDRLRTWQLNCDSQPGFLYETSIMNWLRQYNIRQVQYMAEHKSIRSTENYRSRD